MRAPDTIGHHWRRPSTVDTRVRRRQPIQWSRPWEQRDGVAGSFFLRTFPAPFQMLTTGNIPPNI